jgi:hypothetical protein
MASPIATELSSIASSAASSLTTLLEGAGVSPAEQEQTVAALVASIRTAVDDTLREQQERLDGFRAELPSMRAELATLREVLGGEVRAAPADDSAMPLVPLRQALLASLDASRALRAERAEARKAKEEHLASVRLELDGEEGPEVEDEAERRASLPPDVDAAGGLTLGTLGRLQAKVDAANDAKAARVSKLSGLYNKLSALRTTIGYVADEPSGASISRATVAATEAQLAEIEAEAARRQEVLTDCAEYIRELRLKCEIPEAEWTALPNPETAGLSQSILEAYNAEMEQLGARPPMQTHAPGRSHPPARTPLVLAHAHDRD